MKGLVIFDMGGVLRDSSLAMHEGYVRGFAAIGLFLKVSPIQIWHIRGIGKYNSGLLGVRALLAISRAGINLDEVLKKDEAEKVIDDLIEQNVSQYDSNDVEEVYKIYRDFFNSQEAREMIRIYPDAKEALDRLRQSGYLLAVFSNAAKKSLERDLEELGIENFELILSEEDVAKKKPSGEGIAKILEQTNVSPSNAYYVGDSPTDIIAAKDAGVKSIALTTGMGLLNNLEREKPDRIFENLTSMTNYLTGSE